MEHPAKPHATFESGARAMMERIDGKAGGPHIEAFRANAADPLHAAFPAKAIVHSGPSGMPLAGEAAEAALEALADRPRSGKTLAYIHVPFCETRCLYCMFYQNPLTEEAAHRYADALVRDLELWSGRAAQESAPIHAVYFGGGTPTALSSADLKRSIEAVRRHLPLANDCEITIEGRIHNFTDEKMEAALEAGANRFSLGAQTFSTDVRRSMMRVDDRETMIRRLEKLAGYDEAAVVIDLIYGFPGQSMDVWLDDLRTASSLPLDGVDCYQLNVFERSPLARRIAAGKLPPAADTAMKADMFAASVEFFTRANWRRLSNNHWGRTHRERNIYNELGKSACDCLAFGSGAGGRLFGASFMLERGLAEWSARVEAGRKPVQFLTKPGPWWTLLRSLTSAMESGAVNLHALGSAFGVDLEPIARPVVDQWIEAGLLVRRGEWLLQTVAGQYWHVTLAQLLMRWVSAQIVNESQKAHVHPAVNGASVMHPQKMQAAEARP